MCGDEPGYGFSCVFRVNLLIELIRRVSHISPSLSGTCNTNRDFNTNRDQREKLVSFFKIELENRISEHFYFKRGSFQHSKTYFLSFFVPPPWRKIQFFYQFLQPKGRLLKKLNFSQ
jgi:hypothetical protein